MKPRLVLLSLVLLLLACPWVRSAHAQPSSDTDRAVAFFQEAQKLYEKGSYQSALGKFRQVTELIDSPNSWLYIARCLRKLGRKPRAFEAMSEAVALANKLAQGDSSYLRTRDAAAAEREAIVPEISRVIVAAADPPAGFLVKVNNRTIGDGEFGKQLGVEPGTVEISAEAPGHTPYKREIEIDPGQVMTIPIALRKPGEGGGAGPDIVEEPSDAVWITGFVVAGVGVVGMTLFGVFGMLGEERFSEVETDCVTAPCTDPKFTDLIEEGEMYDLVANIGLGVGAAGIVVGVAMIIFGWPSDGAETEEENSDESDIEHELAVDSLPGGMTLGYRLRF